jgi:regulation of enolase protein 1 (concanavalin A-like superfamily)
MVRAVCFILAIPAAFAAAPPPAETAAVKLRRLFGETVNPDKDCTFALDGEKLKVTIPGGRHNLGTGSGVWTNEPRTTKWIEGDFAAEVTVIRSDPGSRLKDLGSAGLVIWYDETHFATGQRYHTNMDNTERRVLYMSQVFGADDEWPARLGPGISAEDAAKPVRLRLFRVGNTITFESCLDGKTWKAVRTREAEFPAKVAVGIFAERTDGDKPYEAVFENLTVTTLPKKQ